MTRIIALIFFVVVPFVASNATTNTTTGTTQTCDLVAKALEGNVKAVRKMIDANCALNVKDALGRTALNAAVMESNTNVAWLLILSGADVNIQTVMPPLHHASSTGQTEIVRQLIDAGATIEARPARAVNGTGTALHVAARRGHADTMQVLIDKGARVDATDSSNRTPLHYAANYGNAEAVRVLLKANAKKIDDKDSNGQTPLHLTIKDDSTHAPTLTPSSPSSTSNTNNRVEELRRLTATAQVLIESGAGLDIKDAISITSGGVKKTTNRAPLHYAALYNRTEIIRMLAAAGAQINIRDYEGNTPLHLASMKSHADAVRVLLEVGADDRVKNNAKNRAAAVAVSRTIEQMIQNPGIYWPVKAYAVGNQSSEHVDTTMRILCDDGRVCRVYLSCFNDDGDKFQGRIGDLEKKRGNTTIGSIDQKATVSLSSSQLKTLVSATDDDGALDCALHSQRRISVQVWSIADSGNANITAYRLSEKSGTQERATVRFYYGDTSTPYVNFRCLAEQGRQCRKNIFECVDDEAESRSMIKVDRISHLHMYTVAGSTSTSKSTTTSTSTSTGAGASAGTGTNTNTGTSTTTSTDTGADHRLPNTANAKGWYSCRVSSSKPFMVYVTDSVRKGNSLFIANSTTISME